MPSLLGRFKRRPLDYGRADAYERGAVHPIRWSQEFLEAGKKRLVGDTTREATSSEVIDLRKENARLKQLIAETVLENRLLKKSVTASASEEDEPCD
jgi:hypothetical protein